MAIYLKYSGKTYRMIQLEKNVRNKTKEMECVKNKHYLKLCVCLFAWDFWICFFGGRAPLCSPRYSETHSIDEAGLELTDIHMILLPEC